MKITVKDYIEAVRKNGWPQLRGQLQKYDYENGDRRRVAACAAGQAIWNLAGDDEVAQTNLLTLYNQRNNEAFASLPEKLFAKTVRLNDGDNEEEDDELLPNMQQIADSLEVEFKDNLDEIIYESN